MNDEKNTRYRVMQPIRRNGSRKALWSRIGTAWSNRGSDKTPCITVKIDSVPLHGELVLFEDDGQEREETGEDARI